MADDLQTKPTQHEHTDWLQMYRINNSATYRDINVLYAEGNEGDANHQQIQQIKVISAESSFVKESTKRSHLKNTTKSDLNCMMQKEFFQITFITYIFIRISSQ